MGKPLEAFEQPDRSVLLVEYHIARYQLAQDWFYTWAQEPKDITRAHGGKASFLMVDGHCKLLDPDSQEFSNLKRSFEDIPSGS